MNTLLTFALALLSASTSNTGDGDWTALALPDATRGFMGSPTPSLVADGQHIFLTPRDWNPEELQSPLVPAEVVSLLLETRARDAGTDLTLLPGTPPLIASGAASTIAAARATLTELDAAASALDVEVQVSMRNTSEGAEESTFATYSSRMRPGEPAQLGKRETRAFLGNYEVDVAADSGVAAPSVGEIEFGRRISLSVHRVSNGAKLFINGILDIAELIEINNFETDATDLGLVQQPRVASVQIAFSALATPGEPVEIKVAGAPLSVSDFSVIFNFVNANANPGESTLELLDLSFLAQESPRLPPFGLGSNRLFRGAAAEPVFAAVPPRALSSLAGERRSATGLYASSDALLIDLAGSESAQRVRGLIAAYESGRLQPGRIELSYGKLRVELPSTSFAPTRISAGRESTSLTGYQAEIAPETWMPSPLVERSFDGLILDAVQEESGLRCGALATGSSKGQVVSRLDGRLGRIQLRPATQVETANRIESGPQGRILWVQDTGTPELRVIFSKL